MKNILLLCACLLALATPLRAAVVPPADIVVVRILENAGAVVATIVREGKTEQVILSRDNNPDKKPIQSGEGYYKLYHQLYQEGYTLQNSFTTGGPTVGGYYVTLLFVKAP